ncbi:hypothetical protein, partial [Staphylococcus capitis]|uniref:hypothetical protein n=1 Tax=Staphylococcus capitis TaxID=29388 RepID=UPI0011A585BA
MVVIELESGEIKGGMGVIIDGVEDGNKEELGVRIGRIRGRIGDIIVKRVEEIVCGIEGKEEEMVDVRVS